MEYAEPRWLDALVGHPATARRFGEAAELTALVTVERGWLAAWVALGQVDADALAAFEAIDPDRIDRAALRVAMARDGVIVPELVRQLRAAVGPHAGAVHRHATSQDIVDTALALSLRGWLDGVAPALDRVVAALDDLPDGERPLSAVTRMQPALPMEARHRFVAWASPLHRVADTLHAVGRRACVVQVGGPVGDRRELDGFAPKLAAELGLADPGAAWHTDRSRLLELADWAGRLCGALGKIGGDVALMALRGEAWVEGAGGSSSMPHKRNPIRAEVVGALARRAAAHLGLLHASDHELERSGRAWTLEQLVLPQLCADTSAALDHTLALIEGLRIGEEAS